MKTRFYFAAVAALTVASMTAPALAQPQDSTDAGSASVETGSSVALEGSNALANGNVVGGSVAVPLGAGSMAVGSASAAVGAVGDAAVAPVDAAFGTQPLPLGAATVVAQPAPNVPYAPGEEAPKADDQP